MAYLAAARRAQHALQRFDHSGIPMDPGSADPMHPLEWTQEQRQIIRNVAFAFHETIERRQEWDGLRRDFKPWQR